MSLKLRNQSGRARRLSVTGYVEWVLGEQRAKSLLHVVTEIDPKSGAVFARNPYNGDFPDRVAFFDVDDPHAPSPVIAPSSSAATACPRGPPR